MTPEGFERRNVLRGLVAAGCALYLAGCGKKSPSPSPMPGGDQTPAPAPYGMAPQPGGTSAAGATSGGTAGKMAQAAVQYQNHPSGEQSCSSCMHFIPETSTCKLVEGQVSPQGWCMIWAKKTT